MAWAGSGYGFFDLPDESAGISAAMGIAMTGPTPMAHRSGVDPRAGDASAFGTFGELLQGALPDGADFLVTLPVSCWTRARFRLEQAGPLRVFPAHKVKSLRVARAILASQGLTAGGVLMLHSDLPIGKGMASSSADLVATARAVGSVLGLDTSPPAVEAWVRPIEPADGVMHDGVVAFEHRAVRMLQRLGDLPPATIVAVDEGGMLDTVRFSELPKSFSAAQRAEYAVLLEDLTAAIADGDLDAIGGVATRSAELNQRLAPKRNLPEMVAIAADIGAQGVVCAHSGTMLGILLDDADPDYKHRLTAAKDACWRLPGSTSVVRTLAFRGTELAG